jgi:TP901 family phage tail tape measure protein
MRLDASQFDKSVKQSQAELQAFARVAGALPGGRNSVFGALATDVSNLTPALSSMPLAITAVGAALTGAGLAARRAGVEFEASLTKIATLGDDAQQNLNATRQAILDTYSSTAVTGGVTDLAEANYLLQSSGRTAAEAMVDLDIAARASVAGFTDVTLAVDGLTSVTAAWKDTQISTAQASDILFAAVNVGKASFEQIASSLGLVAPIAAAAGVRFEEVAAATSVLSNQGVRTTSIMEGLRSLLLNIQAPTEDFKKQFAGLAAEFGASRLARDGVVKFLQDFDRESGGSRIALRALFSDATAFSTALGLLKNGGTDASVALKQMETAAGSADKALAEMNKSAKVQEQLVRNQISSAWTQFGELLNTKTLPILENIARVINSITDGAAFAQKDVQTLIAKSGSELRPGTGFDGARGFDQVKALRGVVTQLADNPDQFLKALSRDELESLGTELVRLRASGRFQGESRTFITADMINKVVDERLERDNQAAREQAAKFDGDAKLQSEAEARAEEERGKLRREAAAAAATKAAAEAKQKAAELARERQRMVEDAVKLTEELEAAALEATAGAIGALQSAMEKTLAAGAAKLASGVLSPEQEAKLREQLAGFEELQVQMIEAERAAITTANVIATATAKNGSTSPEDARYLLDTQEATLRAQLAQTTSLAARIKLEKQLSDILAARRNKEDSATGIDRSLKTGTDLRDTIARMGDLAQSIATVGDQLELLPRRAVDAIRGIGALAEQGAALQRGWGALGTLGKVGAGIGIAGGVASLAAALFSESPQDRQRREELKANTEALRNLTQRVGALATSSATGSTIAAVSGAVGRINPALSGRGVIADLPGYIAAAAGVTRTELLALASDLGITLNNSAESLLQLRDALQGASLAAYTNTFTGSIDRLNDVLRLDGVTDPIEAWTRRIAVLTDPTTGFPALTTALQGIDLSTVEGRDEASRRARSIYDALAAGDVSASQLGGLSFDQARALTVDFVSAMRDANAGSGTGGFNETRSITEVTGSRLAGLLGSANTFLARIADDIATLRAALVVGPPLVLTPPSLGALAMGGSSSGVTIGTITVQITLTRDMLGGDAGAAVALGESFGQAVGRGAMSEIDAQLRERALRQRLLTGDARLAS